MSLGTMFAVFMIPIVLSVIVAAFVLGGILQEPDRELHLVPDILLDGSSKSESLGSSMAPASHLQALRY